MRYIKKFESNTDEFYVGCSDSEWKKASGQYYTDEFGEYRNDYTGKEFIGITKYEEDLLKKNGIDLVENIIRPDSGNNYPTYYKKGYFTIHKSSDEYFYVHLSTNYDVSIHRYKCDQIEGLIKFLKRLDRNPGI